MSRSTRTLDGAPLRIRPARIEDATAIAAIYTHHVLTGTASFDFEGWPPEVPAAKIAAAQADDWPFLVADRSGGVTGYAYAAPFRDRPGYAFTCENSIYIHPDHIGRRIGTTLLATLVEAATQAGFRQMIAVIGDAEPASAALHRAAGFTEAGRLHAVGRKGGAWRDSLYMQRALGDGSITEPGSACLPTERLTAD